MGLELISKPISGFFVSTINHDGFDLLFIKASGDITHVPLCLCCEFFRFTFFVKFNI